MGECNFDGLGLTLVKTGTHSVGLEETCEEIARQQGTPSSEARVGESTAWGTDHPEEPSASGDLHNLGPGVPGCHGRMDQEGPCSGLRQSAIVINKVCIQSVTIRAPLVVCGKLLQAVVDTGAEVSVLSEAFYRGLPDEVRPPLREASHRLVVADKSSQLKDLRVLTL